MGNESIDCDLPTHSLLEIINSGPSDSNDDII
jgi:hypothetical protein